MIISHSKKFIFVKTAKTAGTSVEIFLSQFCDSKDIITPIKEDDELTRRSLGYPGAQNYKTESGQLYNHMSLFELYSMFPDGYFDDYYKFTIERHPGEKLVSLYYWANKNNSKIKKNIGPLFVEKNLSILKERGWDLYTKNGVVEVDFIIEHSRLRNDLQYVLAQLGLDDKTMEIPNAKGNVRKDKRTYDEILSPEIIEILKTRFADEILRMGYSI